MSLLDEVRAALQSAHNERGHMLDTAATEKRSFSDAEEAKYQSLGTKHAGLTERVSQLEREEKSANTSAAARVIRPALVRISELLTCSRLMASKSPDRGNQVLEERVLAVWMIALSTA
jgi:hypothetical protein